MLIRAATLIRFHILILVSISKMMLPTITDCVIINTMIKSFADTGTYDIFYSNASRAARQSCPQLLWRVARRKLDQIDATENIDHLRFPPGNRLEQLKGDRKGQYSIRINQQYRICFRWEEKDAYEVEITDYH